MASKPKLIIDCDTGVDDAVALLMALDAPVDLLAITCVNGNCSVDEAVNNTLITLKIANKVVPVYRGCSKPLTVHNIRAIVHGADGLGGIAHDYTPCDKSLQPGHAVTKMIELVNKYPGEITLLALGPLTNVATAYRMDENFSSKLKKLVIMGGNSQGKGNKGLAAEFNFLVDPESAQIVVEETLCDCQICGWELCGLDSSVSWEWYDSWLAKASDARGNFVKRICESFSADRKESWPGYGFSLCDPVAMSVVIHPDIVTESTTRKATVETAGSNTRGMLVLEWRQGRFPREGTKPVEIILQIDVEKHKQLLMSLMGTA